MFNGVQILFRIGQPCGITRNGIKIGRQPFSKLFRFLKYIAKTFSTVLHSLSKIQYRFIQGVRKAPYAFIQYFKRILPVFNFVKRFGLTDDSAYIASSANISVVNTVACKATVEPRNAADIITRVQISDFGTVHAARHRSCVRPRNAADIS